MDAWADCGPEAAASNQSEADAPLHTLAYAHTRRLHALAQEVEDRVFHSELQPWFQDTLGMQGWYLSRQLGEVQGPPEGQ